MVIKLQEQFMKRKQKYEELRNNKGSKEWNEWFLRYVPKELESKTTNKSRKHPERSKKEQEKESKFFWGT